jgi:hypothetical protein
LRHDGADGHALVIAVRQCVRPGDRRLRVLGGPTGRDGLEHLRALLTTLYGSLLANVICLPIADKLKLRGSEEATQRALVVDGLLAMQAGQNPRVIQGLLERYLPAGQRPAPA